MNIGYVNNGYQLGGAETVVKQLHGNLLSRGHQSTFYAADVGSIRHATGVKSLYPRVLDRLYHSRLHGLVEKFFTRDRLTDRAFRKLAFSNHDLIHIHNFHGTYASIESLAFVAERKPVVWTFHRFWGITGGCDHPAHCLKYLESCGDCPLVEEWPMNGIDDTAAQLAQKSRLLAPSTLCVVAPSRHLAQTVRGSRVGKAWRVEHVPNGVNPSEFGFERKQDAAFRRTLGIDPGAVTILVVNRDFKILNKGYATIAQAIKNRPMPGVQLVLAGGNSAYALSQLPPGINAIDAGYISSRARLAELYEAADIFLYSSPRENFPCVILEAMSSRCCIVSTPTDGVVEQVEHGVSGMLAESFEPEDLAAALHEALEMGVKRDQLGFNARARVEALFTEDGMVCAHLELYRELIEGK